MNDLKRLSFLHQKAWFTGAAWSPSLAEPILKQDDWAKLVLDNPKDQRVKDVMRHYAGFGEAIYTPATQLIYGRNPAELFEPGLPIGDGEIPSNVVDSAFYKLATTYRCPIPDHKPPPGAKFQYDDPELQLIVEDYQRQEEAGRGNWPGCHGVGDEYHCKITMIDESNMGGHLRANWKEVLTRTWNADRHIGLLHKFVDSNMVNILDGKKEQGAVNSRWTFVSRSSGWIGLATVRTNLNCGDTGSWARFLKTYSPRNLIADWPTLLTHEDTHNKGYGHLSSRNSKQNPYIISGLPWHWDDDPLRPWLARTYTGKKVPVDDDDKDPTGQYIGQVEIGEDGQFRWNPVSKFEPGTYAGTFRKVKT